MFCHPKNQPNDWQKYSRIRSNFCFFRGGPTIDEEDQQRTNKRTKRTHTPINTLNAPKWTAAASTNTTTTTTRAIWHILSSVCRFRNGFIALGVVVLSEDRAHIQRPLPYFKFEITQNCVMESVCMCVCVFVSGLSSAVIGYCWCW